MEEVRREVIGRDIPKVAVRRETRFRRWVREEKGPMYFRIGLGDEADEVGEVEGGEEVESRRKLEGRRQGRRWRVVRSILREEDIDDRGAER